MKKNILNYIEECEAWKVGIKNLHWSADNLSQHELCDDIADEISNFEDLVSEVEQSISGKIKLNGFTPKSYKITSLKSFVEDVISASQSFLKELEGMGEKYVGIKSECETFIGTMQRKLYLVNFTLKEELKKRLRDKINESMYKRIDNPSKKSRSNVTTLKTRIKHIYDAVKEHGLDSRLYHDEAWQAIDFYHKVITDKFGGEVEVNTKPCADLMHADSIESDGGYCDYDPYDHMPRSKQYAIEINFPDGMKVSGYIKCMAAGTVEDPFASYDTCMVLWPKQNNVLETKNMGKQMRLTEAELKQVVKEAAMKILSETPLNYDIDNFSGRWTKSEPSDEEWALADSAANGDYLDNPFNPPNSWDDDEWIDGDKDMENDYSWDLYHRMNNVGKSPIDRQHDIMDAAQNRRDHAAYWTDRDNERGKGLMDKWVNGKRDLDDLEDADFSYDPYKYNESKKPMRVTESELKQVVKEAAMKLIKEYGDTPKGQYLLNKLAARQRFRDKDPHKGARTLYYAGFHVPEDEREYKNWAKTGELGYKDGQSEFGADYDPFKDLKNESIEIKPENKGKFTATKKATGKSTEELTHSKNPLTRKRANFAKMAKRGWKPLKNHK